MYNYTTTMSQETQIILFFDAFTGGVEFIKTGVYLLSHRQNVNKNVFVAITTTLSWHAIFRLPWPFDRERLVDASNTNGVGHEDSVYDELPFVNLNTTFLVIGYFNVCHYNNT